ncbi:MAG: SpoIIE family protein phosphatase [Magnetococcus sp. DMHC-1]|nr:SpoIIE family protein phosphatase [Magnetococcales bacterium]
MSLTTSQKPIILVVDDTPENIDILKAALDENYLVRPANRGRIALKAANILPRPDLILLDIMMPEMDGYEVCRLLKADPATRDIPVIFVTGKSDVEDEVAGLRLGAVDYITKPISIPIVQARVTTHLALRTARQKLAEHNQLLQHEREMIESIIFKMRHADTFDTRHLRHLVSPVEMTAGDMLLSTFTPDGRQLVLLGDFTGHGLPAAMGGPLVSYIFHRFSRRDASGEQIMTEINQQLCLRLPIGIFFAAAMVEVAPDRTRATLWNAGIPDNLLLRKSSIHGRFSSAMPPLGIDKKAEMAKNSTSILLEEEDRLYLFSDGIIEAGPPRGGMFGMERLEAFLEKVSSDKSDLNDLIVLLNDFVGSGTHEDDITIVEILV